MTTPTTPVSGEIWFKAQRVLRTNVQAIVGIAGAAAISAALSRVIGTPAVDARLKRIGLDPAPRNAPPVAPPHVVIGQDWHAYGARPDK